MRMEEDQKIFYWRNCKLVSTITQEIMEKLPSDIYRHIRYLQPFTKAGDRLIIPMPDRTTKQSLEITKVQRMGNILILHAKGSVYEIKYNNIDLEKILSDGENKGINSGEMAPFPRPRVLPD